MVGFLAVSLLISGCGPGQVFGPTLTTTPTVTATPTFAPTFTPTLTQTPTPTSTFTPTVTATPSPTPQPPTPTPKSTTGLVSGRAFWEKTGNPVAGVQLIFGEGVTTLGEGIITDAQGNFSAEVKPGSFYVSLMWPFAGQSDVPCSDLTFTLLGDWTDIYLADILGKDTLLAQGPKLNVEAGEEVKLDIQFSCQ